MTHPWHQDPKETGAEERQAIVDWLESEATECMKVFEQFPESPEVQQLGLFRAMYYRQAASFVGWGAHLRQIKKES
jgi:hypothetical protein